MPVTDHEYEWPRHSSGRNRPCGAHVLRYPPGAPPGAGRVGAVCGEPRDAHEDQGLDLPLPPDDWRGLEVELDRGNGDRRRGVVMEVFQRDDGTPVTLILLSTDPEDYTSGTARSVRIGADLYSGMRQVIVPWEAVREVRG